MKKLLLLSLLILSACSSYDTSMPKVDLIPEAELMEEYTVDSLWWLAYEIDELNSLVDTALANNIDYAKSAVRVNKALYQAKMTADDLWPSLTASTTTSTSKSLDPSSSFTENYSTSLNLSYELDLWQQVRDNVNADKMGVKASIQDQEAMKLALVNSVIDTYFNLLYIKEAIDNTQYSMDYYEEMYGYVETQYEYGRVSALELYTAEQAILNAQNNYLNLTVQQKNLMQAMRDLLNLAPDKTLNINGASLLTVNTGNVNLEIPLESLSLRPDVKAAQYRLEQSFYDLGAMQKSWFPSISIGSSLGTGGASISDIFAVPVLTGSIRINLPFLQWNTIKWNVRTSEANFEEAKLDFIQTVTTALNEVDALYFTYESMLKSFANQEKLYAVEQEILKNRQARYHAGADDLKYLLDSKKSENDARLNLLKAKYNLIKYENAIYKAMGGKLQGKDPV